MDDTYDQRGAPDDFPTDYDQPIALTDRTERKLIKDPSYGARSARFWGTLARKRRWEHMQQECKKRAGEAARSAGLCAVHPGRKPLDRGDVVCRHEVEGVAKRRCRCVKCRGAEYERRTELRRAGRGSGGCWIERWIEEG